MGFKVDHVLPAFIFVIIWGRALATPDGKGSDSLSSSDEVHSEEDDNKIQRQNKQTGHQHKFWVPTYHGNNPLNRKKIGITSSEIEKYDKSIDVSLSGVGKKKNVSDHKNTYDVPSIPFLWSGDEISNYGNKSISFIDSGEISSEESLENKLGRKQKLKLRSNNIPGNKTARSIGKREKSKIKTLSSKIPKHTTHDPHDRFLNKTKGAHKDSVKKEKVSQLFFDELHKVQKNESERDSNYYKKLVKIATENTEKKLGYDHSIPLQSNKPELPPGTEVFAIDLNSKRAKSSTKQNKIGFSTRHEQAGGMDKEFDPKLKNQNGQSSKKIKSSTKPRVGAKTSNNRTIDIPTHNTTGSRIEKYYKTINNASKIKLSSEDITMYPHSNEDESLAELDDYSAWSDVLSLNKTKKKGKKRKQKTGNPELFTDEEDRSIPKWSKKDLKTKADKLRTRQGKITRQEKKQRAVKRRDSKKIKDKINDGADYENYSDDQKKGLRMRTTGEKRYAINSVRNYLEEGDQKYNVRPRKPQRFRQSNRYDTRKDNWNPNDRDASLSDEGEDRGGRWRPREDRNPREDFRERGNRWRPREDRNPREDFRERGSRWRPREDRNPREDFRERGNRWRPREDRNPRAEGRWSRPGGRRSNREEFKDRGPPGERSWNRGGRYKDFQRRNDRYNERDGKFDFNTGEGRYGNERRGYEGRQGRYRERYSNDGDGRRGRGGRRGAGGRRRRGS